ncbi:MAG TPA: hypothetical protein DCZ01_11695 [Elusimicrobia bacterium]|nr:MAG: hypothetical protein A2X37_09835 [Elusimicrobia bacterium GWA2_66_18]HAZ09156.1 hypothetical protein [Elusimicrobiota bacterium]
MSLVRAFGFRIDLPRLPVLTETDLPDLTTRAQRAAGTVAPDAHHIVPPAWLWANLDAPVPGRLIEGTLPDDHHARFLLRLPRDWNGRLVVAAASGITDERTYDLYFSDFALSRGYAFAATDKGVRRAVLDADTVLMPLTPQSSLRRWTSRLQALASFARQTAKRRYGRAPEKTYAVGLSNGGFLARRAAESGFVDGAVEVSGVLWRAAKGNLLRELPAALRATARKPWNRPALRRAGMPAGDARWDPLLAHYRAIYWESSLGLFLSDLDPDYDGPAEDYDLDSRPASVRETISGFENTGDLRAPLISISGRHDFLISCAGHAESYRDLVRSRGKESLHRMLFVENASHIDSNAAAFPFVEPLMPRAHAAFEDLVAWVEKTPSASPLKTTGRSSRRRR